MRLATKFASLTAACVVAAAVTTSASAAIITEYRFGNNQPSNVSLGTASNLSNSFFNLGANYNNGSGEGFTNAPLGTFDTSQSPFAGTLTFTFTPTPDAVDFTLLSVVTANVLNKATTLEGRYNLGSGDVSLGTVSIVSQESPGVQNPSLVTFDLSAVTALQNVSTPVTFSFRAQAANTRLIWRVDDIQLSGEAVPEPASLALLAIGGLMMLPRRRSA